MRKVYDVIQKTFNDDRFPERVIATCKSYQLARGVIARCNTGWHSFYIKERKAR